MRSGHTESVSLNALPANGAVRPALSIKCMVEADGSCFHRDWPLQPHNRVRSGDRRLVDTRLRTSMLVQMLLIVADLCRDLRRSLHMVGGPGFLAGAEPRSDSLKINAFGFNIFLPV
jgi:hypothetical protein